MNRILILLPFCYLFIQPAMAQDIEKSSDHPLLTRYPGSVIEWYDVQAYTTYDIPLGPVTGYRVIDDWLKTEGKLTRIYYTLKGENTISEIFANYKKAFETEGFSVLAKGVFPESSRSLDIGSHKWLATAYSGRFPNGAGITLLQGSSTIGGSCYLAAKLSRPSGDVYVTIAASAYKQDEIVYLVDFLEVESVKDELILVDADAISKAITRDGKIAIYGIFFDFNKTTITTESEPTLAEIASYLVNNPQIKLYVVGHTDMVGDLTYNIELSKARAENVCKTLINDYKINPSRLSPQGVGPLVPVTSNKSEENRSKNRRVELVEQ